MTEEGLNAALLRLQSMTIETYGRMKDIYRREQQESDVDLIATLSMKLANYEGALLTLQQYKNDIIQSAKDNPAPVAVTPPVSETQTEPPPDGEISGEDLEKRSPTYRRSQKRKEKNESKTKKKSE
jgi:hypothetical protein